MASGRVWNANTGAYENRLSRNEIKQKVDSGEIQEVYNLSNVKADGTGQTISYRYAQPVSVQTKSNTKASPFFSPKDNKPHTRTETAQANAINPQNQQTTSFFTDSVTPTPTGYSSGSKVSFIDINSPQTAIGNVDNSKASISSFWDIISKKDNAQKGLNMIGGYLTNLGQAAAGTGDYSAPFIGIPSALFSPLQIFSSSKKEETIVKIGDLSKQGPAYSGALGGTIKENLANQIYINQDLLKPTEQFVYETGINVNKGIISEYQPKINSLGTSYQNKIDTGQLTLDQATTSYQSDFANLQTEANLKAQLNFNAKSGDIWKQEMFKSNFAQSQDFKYNIPKIVEIGGLIGGSIFAPISTGAYLFAAGFSSGTEQISKGNYAGAALGIGIGSLGLNAALMGIGNQITKAQIQGITDKVKLSVTARTKEGEFMIDKSIFSSKTGSGEFFGTSTNIYKLQSGSTNQADVLGISKGNLITTDYNTGKTLLFGYGETSKGFASVSSGSFKGWTPSVSSITSTAKSDYSLIGNDNFARGIKLTGFEGTGNMYLGGTGKTSTTIFGGITKPTGENTMISLSGKSNLNYNLIPTGNGLKVTSSNTFKIENIGYIQKINTAGITGSESSKGFTVIKMGGSGSQSSLGFGNLGQISKLSSLGISGTKNGLTSLGLKATGYQSLKTGLAGSSINLFKTKSVTSTIQKQSLSLAPISLTGNMFSGQGLINFNEPITKHHSGQFQIQPVILIQPLINQPVFYNPTPNSPNPFKPTPTGFGAYGFTMPNWVSGDLGIGTTGLSSTRKRKYKYSPSLFATTFNIKSYKMPKNYMTGLGVRPIITTKRHKRK